MDKYSYIGNELDIFSHAVNWKSYFRSYVQKYLGKNVLEVGAGLGGTTRLLCTEKQEKWMCLEPDAHLGSQLSKLINNHELPACCKLQIGTIKDLSKSSRFDSILYIDVLEHIEDDSMELQLAMDLLNPGGYLIILCPAHQWLYTPFDKSIGHVRRYNRKMLEMVVPSVLHCQQLIYLDSVGLLASSANRILLKQSMPTLSQIKVWDRYFVTLSRHLDWLIKYKVGKSVLGVWRKD